MHQEDPVFYHYGHAQGEKLVLLTRPLKEEQKSRDADTTLASSQGSGCSSTAHQDCLC